MITYLLDTLVNSIKTSLINKLGLDPSTEVDLDDFPELIDEIPILDSVEELTVTENGTYTGTGGVTYNPVNVNLPLGSKSVTANGTYTASDDSLKGYSSVTVAIDDTDAYKLVTDTTASAVKTLTTAPLPFNSLKVGIEAVQDLHGYDKPWAGGAGKNKFGGVYGIRYSIHIPQGTQFTASCDNKDTSTFIYFFDDQGQTVDYFNLTSVDSTTNRKYRTFNLNFDVYALYFGNSDQGKYQIAYGTEIAYSPYSNICPITGWDAVNLNISDADTSNPTTYTENLATTNYGGYWDVTEGEIGGNYENVDLGTLPWARQGDGFFFVNNLEGLKIAGDAKSSLFKIEHYYPTMLNTNCTLWINDVTNQIMAHLEGYTASADFKTAMSGVQLVYELATPTTATTTPRFIKANDGTTNLGADSGKIEEVGFFEEFNA